MSVIADLRRAIETRFPNAVPLPERTVPQVSTGIEALDRILPAGGLPRGRLTTWAPGVGGAAVLRSACRVAVARGERAAWVDSTEGLVPGLDWGGVVLARPGTEREGLECAEELLRCGGFALVVRVGNGRGREWRTGGIGARGGIAGNGNPERVRLCRAAREGGTALVELSGDGRMAAIRIQASTELSGFHWRFNDLGEPIQIESVSLRVKVMAAGWNRESDLLLVVTDHEHTLSVEPALADRRGVNRRSRSASAG